MNTEISLNSVIKPSEDVVSRDVMGELIIVPLTSGIGDMEDEIYTMNDTGRAVWDRLDGKASLGEIAKALEAEYDAPPGAIETDVHGIAAELLRRRMVVEV
ncbi:PqqD family protein [Methanogenium sp. S4BF]|uniref:PqqD family protein n=1 Tax=Methanogenium sp. S4BF TaxID=1789226 RepID=UPI00241715CB|nr:PqqD family protein [Methanogenium sp. S4BF]WFN33514.1 PqqD family protein [Methanogenium sp. S4BF]